MFSEIAALRWVPLWLRAAIDAVSLSSQDGRPDNFPPFQLRAEIVGPLTHAVALPHESHHLLKMRGNVRNYVARLVERILADDDNQRSSLREPSLRTDNSTQVRS